jgi:hypothetical protein
MHRARPQTLDLSPGGRVQGLEAEAVGRERSGESELGGIGGGQRRRIGGRRCRDLRRGAGGGETLGRDERSDSRRRWVGGRERKMVAANGGRRYNSGGGKMKSSFGWHFRSG